jgi:hypothetical protein
MLALFGADFLLRGLRRLARRHKLSNCSSHERGMRVCLELAIFCCGLAMDVKYPRGHFQTANWRFRVTTSDGSLQNVKTAGLLLLVLRRIHILRKTFQRNLAGGSGGFVRLIGFVFDKSSLQHVIGLVARLLALAALDRPMEFE